MMKSSINTINQWREWVNLKKFNWSTFSLISIEFELDRVSRDAHAQVIVLGIGLRLHVVDNKYWTLKASDIIDEYQSK